MIVRNRKRTFKKGVSEGLGCYVYRLVDPRNNETFYVGKGESDRIFAHLNEAEKQSEKDSAKLRRIREIWSENQDVNLVVHRHALSEKEALLVEASLIDLLPGVGNELAMGNRVQGHGTGEQGSRTVADIETKLAAEEATLEEPILLVNIRRRWKEAKPSMSSPVDENKLFDLSHRAWPINPDRHPSVNLVACVSDFLIRQVYEVTEWYSDLELPERIAFSGFRSEPHEWLIGKSVANYPMGSGSSVRWVHPEKEGKE